MSNNSPSEITSRPSQRRPERGLLGRLRSVALVSLVVGATSSLVFMFRAAQHTPGFLLVLFTIWVLSPFVALLWAITVSQPWSVVTRATLYCVTITVTLGSLAIYGELVHVRPAGSANAFLFVAVPLASLVFITIIVGIAAFISSRLSRGGDGN